ncbi:hypothetical protein P7K49_035373 [Saguinus oedipus]|uniref:Uncharacterized protein n=1 Tax=Saguinus oedipus TaxID=9490 RepID=A0ABQ9TMJ4_SAGOE|nr:hypothetical protein P7K49_035373 [Saguinus oedipus]
MASPTASNRRPPTTSQGLEELPPEQLTVLHGASLSARKRTQAAPEESEKNQGKGQSKAVALIDVWRRLRGWIRALSNESMVCGGNERDPLGAHGDSRCGLLLREQSRNNERKGLDSEHPDSYVSRLLSGFPLATNSTIIREEFLAPLSLSIPPFFRIQSSIISYPFKFATSVSLTSVCFPHLCTTPVHAIPSHGETVAAFHCCRAAFPHAS